MLRKKNVVMHANVRLSERWHIDETWQPTVQKSKETHDLEFRTNRAERTLGPLFHDQKKPMKTRDINGNHCSILQLV